MIHLIVVIMGIALMSYMLLSGISYTNPDVYDAREKVASWSNQNLALSAAWSKFHVLYGRDPGSVTELSSTLTLPLSAPDDLHLTHLAPGYAGWCFSGVVGKSGLAALQTITSRTKGQYSLSNECGSPTGISPEWAANLGSLESVPVVLTYKFSN